MNSETKFLCPIDSNDGNVVDLWSVSCPFARPPVNLHFGHVAHCLTACQLMTTVHMLDIPDNWKGTPQKHAT